VLRRGVGALLRHWQWTRAPGVGAVRYTEELARRVEGQEVCVAEEGMGVVDDQLFAMHRAQALDLRLLDAEVIDIQEITVAR